MITFCTLFSGSSGNAVYFATDQGALLVDCGMSGRQVLDALCAAGLDPAGLKALLITHEHSDHVKGVGVLSRRLGLPVYATEGTWQGMDSAGYRIFARDHSVAVATDLGYFSQNVRDAITGADLVLLESNHDPDLLRQNPHYPQRLKTRILGKKGHLSNQSGAQAAVCLAKSGTRHLLLGHLSSENNTPDLAYRTTHAALTDAGAQVGGDVTLHVAARYRASYLYTMA